ncbi:MAG: hypothetical protein JW852_09395 [Spirochaetales bacterium]|nr:hypothetical protein [Spirochaetales bacterium]
MRNDIVRPGSWRDDSAPLLSEIHELEERIEASNLLYGGLKDLDDHYRLIKTKLDTALFLLNHTDKRDTEERVRVAGKQAREALTQTDALHNANVSLDQKDQITDSPEMAEIRQKLQQLVLFGGAALFEAAETRPVLVRKVAAALRKALLKYTGGQHQQTGEKKAREDHLARYEIKEGEEDILLSDRMVIPLSQAVVLIEDEVLPAVEKALKENPGDPELLKRKKRLQDQLADFKTTKFFPRARPHTIEKDLFTAALAGYTRDGEALVTVNMGTIQSSGNTYDHLLEHLRVEIVRDCAGAGVSRELDAEIRKRHSPRAGRGFALLDSLNTLDIPAIFRTLSTEYPFLRRIENREDLKLLADLAAGGRRSDLDSLIESMAREDTNLLSAGTDKLE